MKEVGRAVEILLSGKKEEAGALSSRDSVLWKGVKIRLWLKESLTGWRGDHGKSLHQLMGDEVDLFRICGEQRGMPRQFGSFSCNQGPQSQRLQASTG